MEPLVDCVDPWGRRIVLTERQWRRHVLDGHAELAGQESAVAAALTDPDTVRRDAKHPRRRTFYRRGAVPTLPDDVLLKVTVEFAPDPLGGPEQGFVVTAYPAKLFKKGEPIEWQR